MHIYIYIHISFIYLVTHWKTKNKSLDFSRMKNNVVKNVEKDYMDKYRNIIKELRQRLFKLRGNA